MPEHEPTGISLIDRLRALYTTGPLNEAGEPEYGYRDFTKQGYIPNPIQYEAATVLTMAHTVLSEVRENCMFVDANGEVRVAEEATIDTDLFDRLCTAIKAMETYTPPET